MDNYTNYASYQTINTMSHPEEKAWCISPKFQKSPQQITVELNNGKSYKYACRFPVAEGDVVVIGKEFKKDFVSTLWGSATTGSMGIASDFKPKLEIKRTNAVEVEFVFTQNVDKKLITACTKDLDMDANQGLMKLWSTTYVQAIYPISLLIGKLLSASSIIAFPEFASKDAIQKASDYICKPQIMEGALWSLTTLYDWHPDIYLRDIHINVGEKNEEELGAIDIDIENGAILSKNRGETPNKKMNQYINKYAYMGAVSIMVRGGFKNLLSAFLSANPPIGDFLNELIEVLGKLDCKESLALIEEYKPV